MDYKKFDKSYLVRLDKGDEIVESLMELVKKENIKLGSVSGLGAVDRAEVGLFKPSTKKYHSKVLEKDMEIVNLVGNISEMDGKPYLHLHIALGDEDLNVIGGHLNSATISLTGEFVIDLIEGEIDRELDEEVGINLIKF